ncbi:probable methyltransferase At1g29790 [Lolium rigidum]|jgi:SAM-dependent methyltransferase|uniref:probable methyltransferase At1g29790 n=1 Tax=Lolium rigidum TaxID=89674 RepID=UPI001F5D5B8D|nr:probable methyltransferase At1g29790 [Lolium rigidum]
MDYDISRKPIDRTYKSCRSRALVLLIVVATNTASISILLFSDAGLSAIGNRFSGHNRCIPFKNPGNLSLRDLNVTEYALAASHAELVHLHGRLAIANALVETLLGDKANASNMAAAGDEEKQVAADSLWQRELTGELKLAVGPHKLPLGSTPNMRTEELFPTLGQACSRFPDELQRYMNYKPGGECPSDELFAQRLMLKGCEPLPRRRCRPRSPEGYVEPTPLPASLWAIPPDTSILWDAYTCKNYSCLVNRGKTTGTHHYDCKDCFNLINSREKRRWTRDDGALSYSIDAVLAAKPNGTVRIGLDIGGGSGTFAARMQERGVTVVTTSMNFDGPFNSFIASRGLVPMHLSIVHRLPFFDGTLDIVHSMHVLSHWIPDVILEFALFDIYRVLRPGGLFWLDHFYCLGGQMNTTYVPMFDRIGFNKVRWNARPKLDRGIKFDEWYLSALLGKPST